MTFLELSSQIGIIYILMLKDFYIFMEFLALKIKVSILWSLPVHFTEDRIFTFIYVLRKHDNTSVLGHHTLHGVSSTYYAYHWFVPKLLKVTLKETLSFSHLVVVNSDENFDIWEKRPGDGLNIFWELQTVIWSN